MNKFVVLRLGDDLIYLGELHTALQMFRGSIHLPELEKIPVFTEYHEDLQSLNRDWKTLHRFVRSQQCFDVRDKAFGVLGLVLERFRFYPDYSMNCGDILFHILQIQMRDNFTTMPENLENDRGQQVNLGSMDGIEITAML